MTNKIILPYDMINYINKFLPMPVHPISKLIKEYIIMFNITNKIITVPRHICPITELWKISFYDYMIELRFLLKYKPFDFSKRYCYFHMHPSFDYEFQCFQRNMNDYNTQMNAYV